MGGNIKIIQKEPFYPSSHEWEGERISRVPWTWQEISRVYKGIQEISHKKETERILKQI